MRNEENYLDEWIYYHLKAGVDHFFLYDNETNDQEKLRSIICKYKSHITSYAIKGLGQQFNAYNHCIKNHAKDSYWLAMIDLDEFIVPNKSNDLKHVISGYEDFNGIGVNWLTFGSNGHEKVGESYAVIDRFNRCSHPDSTIDHSQKESSHKFDTCSHIKTIVKSSKVSYFSNPHFPKYLDRGFSCDEKGQLITGRNATIGFAGTDFISYNKLQINHYILKSWEEFRKRKSIPTAGRKNIADHLKSENLRRTFETMNSYSNAVENNRARELYRRFVELGSA